MQKNRLEAFSDGVLAIILTIMVLEMKAPHDTSLSALLELYPIFICYLFSFIHIGIYWNNHHNMLHSAKHVDGSVLWANQHLLFWLSLIPFTTAWVGQNSFASTPVAIYGVVLLFSAIAYYLLSLALVRANGEKSILAKSLGKDFKGKSSIFLYFIGIISSFISAFLGCGFYILVALIWLIPDRRFERKV